MNRTQKYLILTTRILFGILFLWSGISKLITGFNPSGYLNNATSGPFETYFMSMAGNPVITFLVIWGEILIGLGIISGILLRLASFFGIILMTLLYFTVFPPSTGLINQHIIYILVFLILSVFGAGRIYGLDAYIEKYISKNGPSKLRYILG